MTETRKPITWGYIQTYGGRKVWLDDEHFHPESINFWDIYIALPHINRYSGHTRYPYSVAQHCVLLSRAVERAGMDLDHQKWALIHDWPEAFISDIPRPFKKAMLKITELDNRILGVLARRYGLPEKMPDVLDEWDQRMCRNEMDVFGNQKNEPWWHALAPIPTLEASEFQPMHPDNVRYDMIARCEELDIDIDADLDR